MKRVSCLLTCLVLVAQPAGAVVQGGASGSSLATDESAAKNRPVTKVITLLKNMMKQLEKESEEDQELYDNMACWCETNDKDKTKSIKDAEDKIEMLEARIAHLTATSARLNEEIANLKEEVAKNKEALAKATALREKQLKEFNAEEKDLLASISALKAAVKVLSKHHGGAALLQLSSSSLQSIAATLQREMTQHAPLLKGVLSHRQRRLVDAFVQAPKDYFDATPTFKQSYAPQSGEIFGILQQMQETFEKNLADASAEETANQKAYEELKAAKEAEIAAGLEQIDTKTEELAKTDEDNAHAKEDLEDTKNSLSADEKFLMMLKEKCSLTDKEWEERQKTRQDEMTAVSKALSILSGDEVHDLFSRTLDNFLQRESLQSSDRRARAAAVLESASRRLHLPRLSTLASKVRLDAFTRVKKAIDDMVAALLEEKAAEIKQKHFCVEEFDKTQLQTEKKNREKEDLSLEIETLEMKIAALVKAINTLKAEIGEMQLQMKRAGEDREKQNKEFQMTVSDQRATQKVLMNALSVLRGFYGEKALLQRQEPVGPPPPAGFEKYKKNEASGGVMGMIEQIIKDAKAMEAEAIKSDDDAQSAYEAFIKDTNDSIEAKSKEIMNKDVEKAQKETLLVEAKENKAAVVKELEELSNYDAELHKSCDYVLKNFEVRQTARDEEVEALRQAKAILSGANFEEFLQRA